MNDVRFTLHAPCHALRPYIRYYYTMRCDRSANALTFPVGCMQLLFHRRTPLYVPELNASQHPLTVSGQTDFAAHLCSDGNTEMIAAVFRPHTSSLFLGIPASELCNREIDGRDLDNRSLDELAVRTIESDDGHGIAAVEQWLLRQAAATLSDSSRHDITALNLDRIDKAVRTLFAAPQTTVGQLARDACLCMKQFERIFNAMVGMNPKQYAGIVRFQRALALMSDRSHTPSLAAAAHASGYSDQSHFTRECRRLSGYTPAALSRVAYRNSSLFDDRA